MAAANVTSYVTLNEVLFGKTWELEKTISFMNHWVPTSFYITGAYLMMVFLGQKMMKSLPALDGKVMDLTLALWNFAFSLFSGFAAYRLIPELFWACKHMGFLGNNYIFLK